MDINEIIALASEKKASDIHAVCSLPVRFRIDGSLEDMDNNILSAEDCERIASELCRQQDIELPIRGEVDFAGTFSGVRCRINVFRQQGCISSAIRLLSDTIPELESLGLPPAVEEFPKFNRGIVLVTGETGSGKSTTLAAIINRINNTRREHIITLEDPVEYVYKSNLCTVNQREIGTDTESYATGLRAILREDPDIILIGEMRDANTIETALTAAETGHLVFATLHTNSAAETVNRIVDVFPGEKQQQIRLQLSTTLKAVLAQQLLPRKNTPGRVAACELMLPNSAIRAMIRDGKTTQIDSTIATTVAEGNVTMDASLLRLTRGNVISAETAVAAAADADSMKKALGMSPAGNRMVGNRI